jgi:hypothetical protein
MTVCTDNTCLDTCGAYGLDYPSPRALPRLVANSPYLRSNSLSKRLGRYDGSSEGCVTIANPKSNQLLDLAIQTHNCQTPLYRSVSIDLGRVMDGVCNPDEAASRLYMALMQDPYAPGLIQFAVVPQTATDPVTKELTATGALKIEWESIDDTLGQMVISEGPCNSASISVAGSATPNKIEGFIHGQPAFYYPEMDPSLDSVYPWDCKAATKLQFAGFVQECQRCQTMTPNAPTNGFHLLDYGYGYVGDLPYSDCGCACQGCGGGVISVLYRANAYTTRIVGGVTPSGSHVLAISEDGRSLTLHKVGMAAPKGFYSLGKIVSIIAADGEKVAIEI